MCVVNSEKIDIYISLFVWLFEELSSSFAQRILLLGREVPEKRALCEEKAALKSPVGE